MSELKEALLSAPDSQMDASLFPLIEKWDEFPTAIQVLEVLDRAVFGALVSGFALEVLEILLKEAITREGTTYEKVVALAHWRGNEL